MKITICTGPCFPVPAERGGAIPKMMWELARCFSEEGHEVTVFARAYVGQKADECVEGVRIIRRGGFDPYAKSWRNGLRDLPEALMRRGEIPVSDVTLINDSFLPAVLPRFSSRHGIIVAAQQRYPRGQDKLYPTSCRVIAPSHAVAEAWHGRHEVRVIPNPVNRDVYLPAQTSAIGPTLLYAGRLHPEKGLHILLRALADCLPKIPGIHLSIAGPWKTEEGGGGEGYYTELEELSRSLPVTWLGNLHEPGSLAESCRGHQFFVYPSLADRAEAFGLAPLEGMACGCIPIVSSNPVFRDFITDGVSGFVFDHRNDPVRALAACLQQALGADESARVRLREQAQTAAAAHDLRVIARSYLEAFKEWSS